MKTLRAMLITMLVAALGAVPAVAGVLIWEVDYDQPSTDTTEWIELHNPDAAPMSLVGLDLVLRNGSLTGTCTEYCRIALDAFVIAPGGTIVLGQHPCAVAPLCVVSNAIQNGAPDAISIEDRNSGGVVDSVEYEYTGSSVCGLAGTAATDLPDDDPLGSIQFCPGTGWIYATGTPCAANNCPVANEASTWSAVKARF